MRIALTTIRKDVFERYLEYPTTQTATSDAGLDGGPCDGHTAFPAGAPASSQPLALRSYSLSPQVLTCGYRRLSFLQKGADAGPALKLTVFGRQELTLKGLCHPPGLCERLHKKPASPV